MHASDETPPYLQTAASLLHQDPAVDFEASWEVEKARRDRERQRRDQQIYGMNARMYGPPAASSKYSSASVMSHAATASTKSQSGDDFETDSATSDLVHRTQQSHLPPPFKGTHKGEATWQQLQTSTANTGFTGPYNIKSNAD